MNEIIVVDTNIIISTLISDSRQIRRTLARKDLQFAAPKFIIVELFKHAPKIQKATKLSRDEVLELLSSIINQIKFYDEDLFQSEVGRKHFDCAAKQTKKTRRISL